MHMQIVIHTHIFFFVLSFVVFVEGYVGPGRGLREPLQVFQDGTGAHARGDPVLEASPQRFQLRFQVPHHRRLLTLGHGAAEGAGLVQEARAAASVADAEVLIGGGVNWLLIIRPQK